VITGGIDGMPNGGRLKKGGGGKKGSVYRPGMELQKGDSRKKKRGEQQVSQEILAPEPGFRALAFWTSMSGKKKGKGSQN